MKIKAGEWRKMGFTAKARLLVYEKSTDLTGYNLRKREKQKNSPHAATCRH